MVPHGDADIARDLTPDQLSLDRQRHEPLPAHHAPTNQMYLAGNEGYAPLRQAAGAPGDQMGDRL